MMHQSARQFLGLPVVTEKNDSPVGIIETVVINPRLMTCDGFLVGTGGKRGPQDFLPLEAITEASGDHLLIKKFAKKLTSSSRILGLQAWTIKPKFLVGFVYDVYFSPDNRSIESYVIHQLIRTWRIPASAVVKITPRSLLINNDTTIKLKITPYVTTQG